MTGMNCQLETIAGPATGITYGISMDPSLSMGRVGGVDFCIPDRHMSRRHLVVESTDSIFRIRDVGSSNGTYVNQNRVSSMQLCDGDLIQAGTTVFRVHLTEAQPVEPPRDPVDATPCMPGNPLRSLSMPDATIKDDLTVGILKGYQYNSEAAIQRLPGLEENRVLPSSVSSVFAFEPGNILACQRSDLDDASRRILEGLRDWKWQLSLIVNLGQFDPRNESCSDLSNSGKWCGLSNYLYLFQNNFSQPVLDLYEKCLGKDAAVCIASKTGLNKAWLRQVVDPFSFPSLLFGMAKKNPESLKQLMMPIDFLVLESPDRKLCLLSDRLLLRDPQVA